MEGAKSQWRLTRRSPSRRSTVIEASRELRKLPPWLQEPGGQQGGVPDTVSRVRPRRWHRRHRFVEILTMGMVLRSLCRVNERSIDVIGPASRRLPHSLDSLGRFGRGQPGRRTAHEASWNHVVGCGPTTSTTPTTRTMNVIIYARNGTRSAGLTRNRTRGRPGRGNGGGNER